MDLKANMRIQKSRAHTSLVERMTSVSDSSPVAAVDPVSPVTNNTAIISYNSLIASDEFYDKLVKLQMEYKRFYHDQRELEKALIDMTENSKSLVENMRELVEKYNTALSSLKKFDREFNTSHQTNIGLLLRKFKKCLFNIGVSVDEEAVLSFDDVKFRESIKKSNDAIEFLFVPIKGLIISLHREFKNIEVPKESYYESDMMDYNGMITDERI